MMSESVNIVLICDDGYIVPTLTTITSLKKSKNEETIYSIYIIANTYNTEKYDVFKLLDDDMVHVNLIFTEEKMVNDLVANMGDSFCVATPAALLKFFIPELVNGEDKVLYLDGDIIVKEDLLELYQTDITDYYGAVVIDSSKMYSGRAIVKELPNYFNSGVMLLNLNNMKKVIKNLIEEKLKQTDKSLMDQDVFNRVIGGNIKRLSIKYNFLYTNLNRVRNSYSMSDLNQLYGTDYTLLKEIYDEAVIIHFSSKDKPWKCIESPMARIWYKMYREMKKIVCSLKNNPIITEFEDNICDDESLKNALSNDSIDYNRKIIISMTSFPARISYVSQTLRTLLNQSEIADRFILWLAESEFINKEDDLPVDLLELKKYGLEIKWCENIRSHKKYMFTMKENPGDIVVIFDDDNLYDNQSLSYLYKSYLRYPNCVSANRVHLIGFDENQNITPYVKWKQDLENVFRVPGFSIFPTGVGGVLYPPNSLDERALSISDAEAICPTTDDIWLKFMAVLKGTKTVCSFPDVELELIKETQKEALYRVNRAGGENDRQMREAVNYFENLSSGFLKTIYSDYKTISDIISRPAISVVIPINDSEYDISKLRTIMNQSLKNVQYIVLDNGSKGNKGRQLTDDARVIYLSNKGWSIVDELNYAISVATGEYILFVEKDTEYKRDFLKKNYVSVRKSDADIGLFKIDYFDSYTNRCTSSEWEKKYHRFPAKMYFTYSDFKEDALSTFSYRITDKLYRRELLVDNNILFDRSGDGAIDFCFLFTSIIGAKKMTYESEVLAFKDYISRFYLYDLNRWNLVVKDLGNLRLFFQNEHFWNDVLERDFSNYAVSVLLNEYKLVKAKDLELVYNELHDSKFYGFAQSSSDSSYFYDSTEYNRYSYIVNNEYMWNVIRECLGVSNLNAVSIKEYERIKREYKDYTDTISIKNQILSRKEKEIVELKQRLEDCEYRLEATRNSKSFKLAMVISFIPRMFRKLGKKSE